MVGQAVDTGFGAKLRAAAARAGSLVCVGLDPDLARFPTHLRDLDPGAAIVRFNAAIVEATADLVCAYKPNLGFYVEYGPAGTQALLETRKLIPDHVPVILDCKVGDMASTATAYARGYLGAWGFDAITANPYPEQLAEIRARCPDLPILLPGVGAQGGDLERSVRAGVDAGGGNLLVSSSRGVTYAGAGRDFAERAREAALSLRDAINEVRRAILA